MRGPVPQRKREAGYTLVALLATAAITLIAMGAAVSSWRYLMKDDREQELLFRGFQIADAIQRYQAKNGNALPISLDVLVKGKFLRKAYKDPMTKSGKWRFLRPGEAIVPQVGGSPPPTGGTLPPTASPPVTTPPGLGEAPGLAGPFVGVVSTSHAKSLRLLNGRSHYHEWLFAVGQPRVVGKFLMPSAAPASTGLTRPSPAP